MYLLAPVWNVPDSTLIYYHKLLQCIMLTMFLITKSNVTCPTSFSMDTTYGACYCNIEAFELFMWTLKYQTAFEEQVVFHLFLLASATITYLVTSILAPN